MDRSRTSNAAPIKAAFIVIATIALIAVGAWLIAGGGAFSSKTPVAGTPAGNIYTARGQLAMVPSPKRPTLQLIIHHEAIKEFVNSDGTRGMASMEMPFPVAPDVTLDGFAVGDAVEFDLSVWYRADGKTVSAYCVSRMKKLPPGTKLDFGDAAPTLGEPTGK